MNGANDNAIHDVDPPRRARHGSRASEELWADYAAFNEALKKAGGSAGERLKPTTVRQRGTATDVLDGPYADTKEQLAGYFFITVTDLDEAIAWAKRCPSSKYGSIEIRR